MQSSAMALMASAGEILPMPTAAIFADTKDEPDDVYETLARLKERLKFPVITVSAGRLSSTFKEKFVHIPTFRKNKDGSVSMGKRQCTRHFKLKPMYKYIRETYLATYRKPVVFWVGITTDEISRVKPARVKFVVNRWPFIELEHNRHWCENYLKKAELKAAKSACEYCPLHSDYSWRRLTPKSFNRAVKIDRFFRSRGEFLHQSCKPLEEVDFSTEEERGQLNMFNNECEGMCGV